VSKSLIAYKENLTNIVEEKAERLEEIGWENY